jgi:hypothetical protein
MLRLYLAELQFRYNDGENTGHIQHGNRRMLNPSPLRILLAVLTGAIVLLTATWLSGTNVKICEFDQVNQQNNCTAYNLAVFIVLRGGEIINYYGPLVTALAAIAIAGFAATLRQSNDRLLQAGRDKAAAEETRYRILDRAYIAVSSHGVGIVPVPGNAGKVRTIAGVTIDNNGHTPAFMKELYGEFRGSSPVGGEPIYAGGTTWPLDFQVGGGRSQINLSKEFPFYTSNTGHQYFLGYITYDDIYGVAHTSRFCALIMPHQGKWVYAGPRSWNAWD